MKWVTTSWTHGIQIFHCSWVKPTKLEMAAICVSAGRLVMFQLTTRKNHGKYLEHALKYCVQNKNHSNQK